MRSWFIYKLHCISLKIHNDSIFKELTRYTFYSRNPTCEIPPCLLISKLKVTMHLQGCLACKRCSASGLICRYLNPYIKLKLIGLAIKLYQKLWKKLIVKFFMTPKCERLNHLLSVPCRILFFAYLICSSASRAKALKNAICHIQFQ